MQALFSIFPTMVFNEMAGIVNVALRDLGQSVQVPLSPRPIEVVWMSGGSSGSRRRAKKAFRFRTFGIAADGSPRRLRTR